MTGSTLPPSPRRTATEPPRPQTPAGTTRTPARIAAPAPGPAPTSGGGPVWATRARLLSDARSPAPNGAVPANGALAPTSNGSNGTSNGNGATSALVLPAWTREDPFARKNVTGNVLGDVLADVNYLAEPDGTPPPGAPSVLSGSQALALIVVTGGFVTGLVLAPFLTLSIANASLVLFFMAANGMKLVLIDRVLRADVPRRPRRPPARMADAELPMYTILLPVFRETSVLRQLVRGIESLDYPKSLLDVKLLLEEDDTETREAAARLALPDYFDVLVVPDVGPRGKPRACNYGLFRAKGKYLVIFDAEDQPDPDQLRTSVAAFANAAPDVVCHQAKLNYFNRTHNLLTRWFTSEYSVWFDQLLPGLQLLDVAIPLGGTSNHFITERLRGLGGWNPFNVTEDAELGVRIYVRGWKTAILDTTTYEEATSQYRNWIRQRSRWVKGYMQTYLMCMRRPVALARRMGLKSFVSFQLFFGANSLCLLINPVFWSMIVIWFATHAGWIPPIFPGPVFYVAVFGLLVGNGACILSLVSGSVARRHYSDVKWAFFVPIYWLIMSVASYKALFQLVHKPSYWEKTEHGVCQYEPGAEIIPLGLATVHTESS